MSQSQQQSEVYSPQHSLSHLEQRQSNRPYQRRLKKANSCNIEGRWTTEESIRYALFIDYHSKIFASKEKRKSTRIFKSLSMLLGTRTPRQCRSHFQKLMSKFKRTTNLKAHYLNQLGSGQYQAKLEELAAEISSSTIKSEDSRKIEPTLRVNVEIQTDPQRFTLDTLTSTQILNLMGQLHQQMQMNGALMRQGLSAFSVPFNFI